MTRQWVAAVALLAGVLAASPAWAIDEYESEDGETAADLIGFFRMSSAYTKNPGPELLYPNDNDHNSALVTRLLSNVSHGEGFELTFNAFQAISSTSGAAVIGEPQERGRSDALSYRYKKDGQMPGELAVDHLNARISADWLDVRVGRQPISLATSYLFTPNDFFSPFSAQTFFRTYKPGVDAARVEATISEFTQVAAYGVIGYRYDPDGLDRLALGESAGLVRASTVFGDFEVAALAGKLHDRAAFGGDFQGEVGEWLGVRGEGHFALPDDDEDADPRAEVSVGVEHRFENTLFLRFEYFWHGAGLTETDEYLTVLTDPGATGGQYLGRQYLAGAASYELTPLLNMDSVLITNLVDGSVYASLYLLYSVSDESELALIGSLPLGEGTSISSTLQPSVGSEFGLYPASVGADFRLYF